MTPAQQRRAKQHLVLVGWAGLILIGTPGSAPLAEPDPPLSVATTVDPPVEASRLQALEQRVDDLVQRLERLESAPGSGAAGTAAPKAGDIQWSFDAALSRGPFNVSHQSFDRGSGRFDVLLKVVDPIPDPQPWKVAIGAPVPVVARIGLADGSAAETLVFRLARGQKLDPGAVLHIEAQVSPEQAAAISGLSIELRSE